MKIFKTLALVTIIALQAAPTDLFAAPKKDRTKTTKKEKTTKHSKRSHNKKNKKCSSSPQTQTGPMRVRGYAKVAEPGL